MSTSPLVRFARSLRWWHFAAVASAVTAALVPIGCGDDGIDLGPGSPPSGFQCRDDDGDGFGLACAAGADCDDADPTVTNQCLCDEHPAPGCPCTTEGEHTVCGEVTAIVGSQLVCGMGDSICSAGVWGPCIINNTVTLAEQDGPAKDPQTLGAASDCLTNPCDPYCVTFNDDPTGLTAVDAGIVATNGGLSLIGNLSIPAAQCTTDPAKPYASCGHHICEAGASLAQGCDDMPGPPILTNVTLFTEDFANNNQGWSTGYTPTGTIFGDLLASLGAAVEWHIAVATASVGGQPGFFQDPSTDKSPTADNHLAGVKVGGHATTASHGNYYLISPAINASNTVSASVSFWRRLNSDAPLWMRDYVYACTGAPNSTASNCSQLYLNNSTISDAVWTQFSYTIPPARLAANLRIVFGIGTSFFLRAPYTVSSWNIDDIQVSGTVSSPGPSIPGCVSSICAVLPNCCTTTWDYSCTNLIGNLPGCPPTCGIINNFCSLCYHDNIDHDGDGFTGLGSPSDCADCDPNINPGAYDFPLNLIDEDCSGAADDEVVSCDVGLPNFPGTNQPYPLLNAIELCRTTTAGGANWGVISPGAGIVRPNAWPSGVVPPPPGTLPALSPLHGAGFAILPNYGTNNKPLNGANMLVLSSGTARRPNDAGYISPQFQISPSSIPSAVYTNDAVPYPPGFPKFGLYNGNLCPQPNDASPWVSPVGPLARDSVGVWFQVKVPTNTHSFSFNFDFFTSEYPIEICTDHNDQFVALLKSQGHPLDPVNGDNIAFDLNGNAIGVNNALFSIPGGINVWQHPHLIGTGFDEALYNGNTKKCNLNHPTGGTVCGGATDWLVTTVPVNPGETITMMLAVWDAKFHTRDALVLIDNWQWSVNAATLQTTHIVPPPPVVYTDGYFTRDYDVSNVCPLGTTPTWGLWSWTAITPSDTKIEFFVQTASTAAGLGAAPMDALQFSNPPYPSNALTGNCSSQPCAGGVSAVAKTALAVGGQTFDTQIGSSVVDTTLEALGRSRIEPYVRITSHLAPSTDKASTPTLAAWNLQVDCIPDQ